MNEHADPQLLTRFSTGSLSPEELLLLDDHLATCPPCRAAAVPRFDPNVVRSHVADALRGDHRSYEALEAAVDETLTREQREEFDRHLATCGSCSDEFADLAEFKRSLAPAPRRTIASLWWVAAAAALLAVVGVWMVVRAA
jgi:hypothetical protein